MGRARQKYRPRPVVLTDDREASKIEVDLQAAGKYDSSNALVLPSQKRATKQLRDKSAPPAKLLSKRKRKLLQKVVDQKAKKANRASLLASLQEVRADPKDLARLTQLQETQTLGRKHFLAPGYTSVNNNQEEEEEQQPSHSLSCVRGAKRKGTHQQRRQQQQQGGEDGSVVRLGDVSSSSEESEEEEEEEEAQTVAGCSEDSSQQSEAAADTDQQQTSQQEDQDKLVQPVPATVDKPAPATTHKPAPATTDQPAPAITDTPVKRATFLSVERAAGVQEGRLRLPILAEEQAVMEAVRENLVTVVVGSTGSGKTTQVPQFLYEAGYTSEGAIIGVTEPRRVAAVAMSQRVAYELNLSSREVSYQIRFEGNTTPDTKIKFMTDGVLLKEVQQDPTLRKYSVIIIDEAHERSVFSDILIGILSRILPRRQARGSPLRLIIMSATLRVEDFTVNPRLFKQPTPPVIKVDARMFEVTIHYNKRTADDYPGEAYKKTCSIHRRLPEGGILIFLTGQQEVNTLVRKLRATFPMLGAGAGAGPGVSGYRRRKQQQQQQAHPKTQDAPIRKLILPDVKLDNIVSTLPDDGEDEGAADQGADSDLDDQEEVVGGLGGEPEQPLWVLPLYSVLPPEQQRQVFEPPPEGTRLCVVATNVAETSLTIPSVKYVVDCGRVKEKVYDKVTGVSMFHVTWTSQASANQRAGRAGRTAPGHCYRLYSSAVFNDFAKFAEPEVVRRPIEDLLLVMKAMKLPVVNFPFPTPPHYLQVRAGMKRLVTLGALEEQSEPSLARLTPAGKKLKAHDVRDRTVITALGRAMAALPLAPRYGKMVALSQQHQLLPYTVALVAALTVPEVLVETPVGEEPGQANEKRRRWGELRAAWAGTANARALGDLMVLLRAVGAAEYQGGDPAWCLKNGLRHKGVTEIRKLRRQLTNELNLIMPSCDLVLDPSMPPPTDDQARLLRQVVLAGAVDHVARRVDDWQLKTPEDKLKWKHAYRTQDMEEPVFLPASSVLRQDMPRWVVFQELYETHKMFMRNVTAVEAEWLPVFAPNLCTFSPPLETPEPRYDPDRDRIVCHRNATFGGCGWEVPSVEVEHPPGRELYRWVAFHLLQGHLCPRLLPFSQHLLEPRTLVNPVAIRFRKQRDNLLQALMTRQATNYTTLTHIWTTTPTYLLYEYLQWVKEPEVQEEVRKLWPPLTPDTDTDWS